MTFLSATLNRVKPSPTIAVTTKAAELKAAGAAIFCWTIRSEEQAAAALHVADQITFEGYLPKRPASA